MVSDSQRITMELVSLYASFTITSSTSASGAMEPASWVRAVSLVGRTTRSLGRLLSCWVGGARDRGTVPPCPAPCPAPCLAPAPSRLMRVEPRPSGICVPDTPALTVRTPGCWPAPCPAPWPTSILSSVTMSPDWGPDLTLKAGRPLAGGRGSGRGWAGEGWRCLGVMLPGPALGEEDTTTSGGTRGRGLRLSTDWAPEAGAAEAEGATKRREGGVVAGGAQLRSEERGGE